MDETIEVIFENEAMMVLNKPAGWVTTTENSKLQIPNSKVIEIWLKENYPNGLPREGIVHRLDKGTSGILVVAKTKESLDFLKGQFKERKVVKHYWALVSGEVVNGSINMPIGRSRYQFSRFGVRVEGKMAITEFKVIKRLQINGRKYSMVEVNLKTGRTHQIRVHMNYLGWPLVGDRLYGGEMIGLNRPFLQAKYLEIVDPVTKKNMKFEVELASDLMNFIKTNELEI